MTDSFDLEFCFKGDRNYIHGTDIFNKLTEKFVNNISKIDISFHSVAINNMTFFTQKPETDDVKVTFRCQNDGEKIKLFGIENGTTVDCRYEYPEEDVVKNSTMNISDETIILDFSTDYSFIEHIVAMNKSLLETLYTDVNGKWYFTRLQLHQNVHIDTSSSITLQLKSNFQFKLTKSSIIVDENEVGFIYFSLVAKES